MVDGLDSDGLSKARILDCCADKNTAVASRHQIDLARMKHTRDRARRPFYRDHLPASRNQFDVQTQRFEQVG